MVKESKWMDAVSFLFSAAVALSASAWLLQHDAFSLKVLDEPNSTWYLVRSAGISAYILMTLSIIWGLAVSSRVIKDWSPGVLSMLLHGTISWLTVLLGIGHALLLLKDEYFTYQLTDIVIPFVGPYKPLAVGLGTLALWIGIVVALSFRFKKQLGNTLWKRLHYSSYAMFVLITLHGLLAGSDASNLGFRLLLGCAVGSVVLMLSYKMGKLSPH